MSGTAFSHIIFISTLPIITRLYTPDDFKVLAIYSAILSIVSVLVCLRFEVAVPLPKYDSHACILVVLSLISTVIINILIFLSLFIFQDNLKSFFNDSLVNYFWLIPIGGVFIGFFNAFQYWNTRKKDFLIISKTRVIQTSFSSILQIIYGLISPASIGLIIGYIIRISFGFFITGRKFFKENWYNLKRINKIKLIVIFRKYKKFPKYSVLEGLFNSSSIQIPVLLIAFYSAGPEVGFLMLASQLLSAPMSLIGQSVAQAYLSEARNEYQRNNLTEFTHKIIIILLKSSVIPLFLGFILFPYLIPIFLGDEWSRVGVMMSWMVPWFFMQFITSPISMSLHVTNNQSTALLLQIFGFLFRNGMVIIAGCFLSEFIFEIYAVTGFIFYSIYLFVVLRVLGKS
ncbi:lipopolysaccharide biosynthesis protein [Acinetobacter sp. DSM 11652]|uniref:lipopolysaccharide biosynthesis protein n=1 Tax=Acinetobacter sp. DSM 11652 TaxID=346222 RepID=UPI00148A688F|nr:oligosaccharide flippase family protein [Acinetobacter sp. DSM 11652]